MNSPILRLEPPHETTDNRPSFAAPCVGLTDRSCEKPAANAGGGFTCIVCALRRAVRRNAVCPECKIFMKELTDIIGHRMNSARSFQGDPIEREERLRRYEERAAVRLPLFNDPMPTLKKRQRSRKAGAQ